MAASEAFLYKTIIDLLLMQIDFISSMLVVLALYISYSYFRKLAANLNIHISRENKKNNLSDEWIEEQINFLMHKCRPKMADLYFLDPVFFDQVGNHRDQIHFLIKRYNLPYEDIEIYLHGNLSSGRPVGGLACYPENLNLDKVGEDEIPLSMEKEKTITLNMDRETPTITIKSHKPLPLLKRKAAIYLNQDDLLDKEWTSATIAHEVAHLYLYYHGIHAVNIITGANVEYQTDLATFIMGLGNIMLRRSRKYDGGYLTYRQMKLAQSLVNTRYLNNN